MNERVRDKGNGEIVGFRVGNICNVISPESSLQCCFNMNRANNFIWHIDIKLFLHLYSHTTERFH